MTKPIVRNESFTDNSLQLEGIRMKGFACVSRHMWGWSVPFSGRVSRPPAPWTLVNLLHPDWFGSLEQCSRNNKSMPLAHEASEVAALSQGEIWPLSRKANQSLKVPCFHAIFYLCPVISWTPGRVAFFFPSPSFPISPPFTEMVISHLHGCFLVEKSWVQRESIS